MTPLLRATALSASMLLANAQAAPDHETWGLLTRTDDHRTTVYRYIDELGPHAGERALQGERVTLRWRYDADANNGMPTDADKAAMDELEDLLDPAVERDGFSNLALVTTGVGERRWIYYVHSGAEFRARMDRALRSHGPYPVEVEVAADPGWTAWEDFRAGLR